jgi:hypothetical protein
MRYSMSPACMTAPPSTRDQHTARRRLLIAGWILRECLSVSQSLNLEGAQVLSDNWGRDAGVVRQTESTELLVAEDLLALCRPIEGRPYSILDAVLAGPLQHGTRLVHVGETAD